MMKVRATNGPLTVVAYRGDAKTLVAMDLTTKAARKRLAGFTIQVKPPGKPAYYVWNRLQFRTPADHAQDPNPAEPARSSINAPFHKFRWVHVPGLEHQGLSPAMGPYIYTVTPRYFDGSGHMLPIDPALSAEVAIEVAPFEKGAVKIGFTRGFTQSQAFVTRFGLRTKFKPTHADLRFDTSAVAGANDAGETFTFAQLYGWSGFTARDHVFEILRAVRDDTSLKLDLFAYDFSEPDVIKLMLEIGARARVILDNAALHHSTSDPKPEDEFATLFATAAGADKIKRGKFTRYAHDKVIVVYRNETPIKVLTGSTNLSVTGLYVNSNHVLVFDDADVAALYAKLFQTVWDQNVAGAPFRIDTLATKDHDFASATLPDITVSFSPHTASDARAGLTKIVDRAALEANEADGLGSVLFAVMELQGATDNPVYTSLSALHQSNTVFSYGISDNPDGIALYRVGAQSGVLVTGKPQKTRLPPPFNQVPNIRLGHQVHHKFVVCGFNGANPTTYCGSSNLALLGEQQNGDNLLTIRDADIAACFAIEALALVDHFNFLDSTATEAATNSGPGAPPATGPLAAVPSAAAIAAGWFLGTTDAWVAKYFDPHDLHSRDRRLFVR